VKQEESTKPVLSAVEVWGHLGKSFRTVYFWIQKAGQRILQVAAVIDANNGGTVSGYFNDGN
jgi:hypothetical protein